MSCQIPASVPTNDHALKVDPAYAWSLFCFVALRPKSTAMAIAGRSVHLTTLFSWANLNKQLTSNRAHTFACN